MNSVIKKIKGLLSDAMLFRIDVYSAASSFGFVISIIPFLIIILMFVPYTPLTVSQVVEIIGDIVPSNAYEFANNLVNSLYEGIDFLPFSIIVMLWSSSWMMFYIRHALNDIYKCEEKQNYLYLRLFGTVFLLLAAIVIVLSSLLGTLGGDIRQFLLDNGLRPFGFMDFILRFRIIMVILVQTLIFLLMYCFVPSKKNKFKTEIYGAIFTSLANSIFLYIINFLLDSYLSFSMYGSLAAIVLLMFYFYFIFYFFFLGALINSKRANNL